MVQTSIISNSKGEILNPLVSVIIPCYNRAHFLPETLGSVLGQCITDIECIVVDDGSTDDTMVLMNRFCARDPRVRYFRQENNGPSAARNFGLEEARGRFIQFLDSDDIIVPDKLAKQLNQLKSTGDLSLSYCDYRYCAHDDINKNASRDNLTPPRFVMQRPLWDIASRWETGFSIPMHCFLFDARFFNELGIRFDEELANHEDWDCWIRIFTSDPIIFHISEVLAIYRLHDDSICTDSRKLAIGFEKAIRKQQRIFRNDPIMRRILKDKMQEIKKNYSSNRPNSVMMNFRINAMRAYKKVMPWPIQKYIINISRVMTQGAR